MCSNVIVSVLAGGGKERRGWLLLSGTRSEACHSCEERGRKEQVG